MISPITSVQNTVPVNPASQPPASTPSPKPASLPHDTVSISPQAHAAATNPADVDHDGDSH